jgi:hypothetical protein
VEIVTHGACCCQSSNLLTCCACCTRLGLAAGPAPPRTPAPWQHRTTAPPGGCTRASLWLARGQDCTLCLVSKGRPLQAGRQCVQRRENSSVVQGSGCCGETRQSLEILECLESRAVQRHDQPHCAAHPLKCSSTNSRHARQRLLAHMCSPGPSGGAYTGWQTPESRCAPSAACTAPAHMHTTHAQARERQAVSTN